MIIMMGCRFAQSKEKLKWGGKRDSEDLPQGRRVNDQRLFDQSTNQGGGPKRKK